MNRMDEKYKLADAIHSLRWLVREPSVVGTEDAFFRVLRREFDELPVTVQRFHGLLVVQGSKPDSMYLSAHADRNGLLCTGPNEFQYAAFLAANRGELDGDSISEQFMETISNRFHGQRVQAHLPYAGSYLGQGLIERAFVCPSRKNLIFEIDGLEFLQPGTPVSFVDRLVVNNGKLSAQLDNVIMVMVILHLFRLGYQGTALFAAGEEAGRSWRYLVEWFLRSNCKTDRLLVLDTSPFPEEVVGNQQVVLRNCDANGSFDPVTTQQLRERCERLEISFCFKDEYISQLNRNREKPMSLGRTELGRIITATNGEISGTTLQLPTSSYHTAQETASIESLSAMLRLLCDLAIPSFSRSPRRSTNLSQGSTKS
jgi:putative aminopeptidase FrvX